MLLHDPEYIVKMNEAIEIELSQSQDRCYQDRWELLKLAICNTTLQYSNNKKKSADNKIAVLEKKLQKLQKELEGVNPLIFKDTEEQLRLAQHELDEFIKIKTQGAILRSRAHWAEHGDKPSKYFLNLEKKNYLKKTLYHIKHKSGQVLTNEKEILEEIRTFYEELYTSRTQPDLNYVEKLQIPKILDEEKASMDRDITMDEMGLALFALPNNKVGGTDGIPPDFYKVFWIKLKDILLEVYKETINKGCFHLSARRGIISLLEKVGKEGLEIKNWHPLSLLNTDNKIYSKMLAKCMQKCMSGIVHYSQNGFMPQRYMAEGIMKLLEVMNWCGIVWLW